MRKRILSALLTLVMLLSLVPAMGTTASAADAESHPTKVGLLGGTYEAYYIAEGGFAFAENNADSSEAKWNAYKARLGTKITEEDAGYMREKTIEGVAYYDKASGVLYITGNVYTCVSAVVTSTARDDVLKVVVDGNTNNDGGWCVTEVNHCLDKLNIEFRNNGTLTLRKRSGNSAVLGVIGYNGQPGSINWGTDPFWFGDLELSGTGKLKIKVSDDEQKLLCGIRARDISIKDNVSLDIKMGKSNASVMYRCNAAMICKSLTIDTTGTVQIDTALEDSSNRFSVFAPIANYYVNYNIYGDPVNSFNLVNAQSVTLKANAKNELFDTRFGFSGTQNNLGDRICEGLETNGWTVTKPDTDDAKPYTVTMTRQAKLENLTLNVGGNSYAKGKTIPDYVVGSGSDKLSVSFDAGPQWFTTYYLKNKINLNASVSIWKDGVFQSDFSIAQMSFGRTNGTLGFTLDVRNLGAGSTYLEANHTYSVYVSVSPIMSGDYLAESLTAQWTFKTVDEPVDKAITAVGLKQDFYLTDSSNDKEPAIDISGDSQPYTITNEGSWAQSTTESEVYTRTVTLKANDGYKFTDSTKVTAVNNDGAKPVDGVGTPTVSGDGSTLSVTITTYKRYTVDFLKPDGTGGMATQYVKKDGKAVAPENRYAVPDGKVFVGWKQDLTSTSEEAILPGDQTAKITRNTTYYAVLEDAPTYGITLSKLLVEPKVAAGEEATFYLTIKNTGTGETGNLTVFFKMNSSNHFEFTDKVEDSETSNPITDDVSLDSGELTIPSIAIGKGVNIKLTLPESTDIGDYGCAVQVKGADSSSTLKSNIVLVKTTVAKRFTINLYRSTDANPKYSDNWFVGDVFDLNAVGGNLGALRAHETFTGWTANKPEIVFEDPTAMNTKFVVPYIDTSDDLAITANFAVATVNGIAITQMPKTDYEVGQSFDPAGIEVELTYTDGTTEALPTGAVLTYEPNTTDALTTSTTSVKVSYTHNGTELSTYLPITVKKPNAQTYTVTYDPGEGSGYMEPGTATEGELFPLPTTCTFTPPTGKVFDKWQINGTGYQPGQPVDIATDTTVTAVWKAIPAGAVTVPLPTAKTGLVYNGSEQTGVNGGTNYKLSGTFKAKDAGTYYAYAELDGVEASKTYYWEGGTTGLKLIEWTINPASQAAPTGPLEMDTRTTDSITLKKISGAEYSMDGSYWQSSPEFTGLSSGTSYTFFARIPASADGNYSASDAITATFYTLSGSSSSGSGSTTYTVKVLDSKNGDVTSSHKTAAKGTTVTLTVSPDKGYTLDDLTVLDKNDKEIKLTAKNGKYTFTMPASNVEVEATFKAAKSGNPFVDVPSGAYYEDAVIWAVEKGVTGGTSATTFNPNGICTRAQAVTFLWRAAGSPAPKSTAMPFTDVKAGSYYEQAVLWAVENGITKGTSDTTFSPNATCSRAQIVTFLWRSQKSPAAGSVNPFTDVSADAYYADAVLWAVKESVTSGTTATTFSPNANCTRAQIVTFIYRALAE